MNQQKPNRTTETPAHQPNHKPTQPTIEQQPTIISPFCQKENQEVEVSGA